MKTEVSIMPENPSKLSVFSLVSMLTIIFSTTLILAAESYFAEPTVDNNTSVLIFDKIIMSEDRIREKSLYFYHGHHDCK